MVCQTLQCYDFWKLETKNSHKDSTTFVTCNTADFTADHISLRMKNNIPSILPLDLSGQS